MISFEYVCQYLFYIDNKWICKVCLPSNSSKFTTQIAVRQCWSWEVSFYEVTPTLEVAQIEMNETTSKRHLHNFPLPMEAAFIPLLFR